MYLPRVLLEFHTALYLYFIYLFLTDIEKKEVRF